MSVQNTGTETVTNDYGADQIQILEGLEAVRKDLVCILVLQLFVVFIILYMK